MTERIDHVAAAIENGKQAERQMDRDRAAMHTANAQVHATLALVEQQRIANLIALGMIANYDGQLASEHDGNAALDARVALGLT